MILKWIYKKTGVKRVSWIQLVQLYVCWGSWCTQNDNVTSGLNKGAEHLRQMKK